MARAEPDVSTSIAGINKISLAVNEVPPFLSSLPGNHAGDEVLPHIMIVIQEIHLLNHEETHHNHMLLKIHEK